MQASRFLLATAGIIGLSWLPAAPAEARDASSFGGNGGGVFRGLCKPGQALFAYTGRAGKALDRVRPLCIEVRSDKGLGPAQFQAGDFGGNGGEPIRRTCPDSVVTHIRVKSGKDNLVSQIDLHCTNLKTGAQADIAGRTEGKPNRDDISACDPDEVAIGLYGRHGAMVDRLGLICEKKRVVQAALAPPPPKPTPPQPTTPKPTPPTPKPIPQPTNSTGCTGLAGEELSICTEHNLRRARHGVPDLDWDPGLKANAAAWVKQCKTQTDAQGNEFFCHQHKPTPQNNFGCGTDPNYAYGENLAWGWGTPTLTGAKSVYNWYCEIDAYTFNPVLPPVAECAGYKNEKKVTGHFTQVVWRDSKRLGCAKNTCTLGGRPNVYWACEYDPPGNFNARNPGVLDRNVPRPVKSFRGGK